MLKRKQQFTVLIFPIFLFAGVILPITTFAQIYGNGISKDGETVESCPDDCKSTYFLLGDIEKLKEKAIDISPGNIGISSAAIFTGVKEKADSDLESGPEYIQEPESGGIAKEIGDILLSHALVYRITGEDKYLDRAIGIMEDVSGWEKWNHIYADDDLNSLDRDATLISQGLAYNWLYSDLDTSQKKIIRDAIIDKGILPIDECLKSNRWPFDRAANSNHYIAGVGALGLGSMAVLYDEPEMEQPLQNAINAGILFVEQSGGKDGGYPESIGYGNFSISILDAFNQVLTDVKGIDMLEYDSKDWIRKFNMFIIHSFFPNTSSVVLFNDQLPLADTEQLMRCARMYEGSDIAKKSQFQLKRIYEKELANFCHYTVFSFLNYDSHRPVGSFDDLDNFKLFSDIGHGFYREDWNDENSFFVTFKAEQHNEDFMDAPPVHLHADGGQFVIYKDGNEYITDLGYQLAPEFGSGTYLEEINTFSRTSLGHNNMLFEGEYQQAFESRITDAITENSLLYLRMDLKNSYPTVNLDKYNREFILLSDSTLITADYFYGKNLNNYSYRLQLTKREKNGVKINNAELDGLFFDIIPYRINAPLLHCKVLYPNDIMITKESISVEDKYAEFIEERGDFTSDNPHYLINLFTFSDVEFTLEDKGSYFFITDGVQEVYLSKQGNIQIGEHTGKVIIIGKDGEILIFVEESSVIKKNIKDDNITLHPNPTSGIFTIEGKNLPAGQTGIQSIEIANINGQIVYSSEDIKLLYEYQVDLSEQPKGIYFVKIRSDDFISVKKIVLQ